MNNGNESNREAFARHAATAGNAGTLSDFAAFLKQNKKWWLLPILVSLIAIGGLIALSSSVAAPFIYTLF